MLRQPGTLESGRGARRIEFLAGKSAPYGQPLPKASLAAAGDAFGYLTTGHAMNQKTEDWCVYIVQFGKKGPVKIGMTCDVERRISESQTFCPATLYLLAKMPCESKESARTRERMFHQKFRALKVRGEWFDKKALRFFVEDEDAEQRKMAVNQQLDRYHLQETRKMFGSL